MNTSNNKLIPALSILDNFIVAISSYLLISYYSNSIIQKMSFIFIILFIWNLIAINLKLYKTYFYNNFKGKLKSLLKVFILFSGFVFTLGIFLNTQLNFNILIVTFLCVCFTLKIISNYLVIKYARYFRKKGFNLKRSIVVGNGDNIFKLLNYFKDNLDAGYQVIGFIDPNNSKNKNSKNFEDLEKFIIDNPNLDEVIVALPNESSREIKQTIEVCNYHGIRAKYIPDYSFLDDLKSNVEVEMYNDIPVINLRQNSLDKQVYLIYKRIFDVLFSFVVLFLLSPLFIIVAILIKMDSKGPVLYKPIRIGRNGREFEMYKFRSMKENDSVRGGKSSTKLNDSRITKMGAIIRKTSIDELPQFLNVFLGQMSVVGPRPHRGYLNKELQNQVKNYMLRHYLKPGITGWAQVNGWRGPTDTIEQKTNRTIFDLYYVENWSFWFDIQIIWLTIFGKKTHNSAF
ncbi:undecaprenyl-phosphate glucose phosphotransferase [Mariniflexile litorale]|uniref:Undecaprenyl-phosphate glucose phosphotransferase n=1 Tax=Mariniflexile litorale TaxID=3045158 RepID=A0AAU7EIR9_9FLAO|nr:undecaprenyl-phosphate glucose phosphotransferase [Mariniflexile sp. KMM 9835]MDQ8209912.1 undecaprenyl-phosphate glucose phosphotransferase [Mariniflexile sp. KMM 9835]